MVQPEKTFFQKFTGYIGSFVDRVKGFSAVIPWDSFQWTANYTNYVEEGYEKNSIAYYAISKIAEKCSEIPLKLYKKTSAGKELVEKHEILTLLERPNVDDDTYQKFVTAWVSYLKLAGESYMLAPADFTAGKFPKELYAVQPDKVSPKFDSKWGLPVSFDVRLEGANHTQIEVQTGKKPRINFTKLFNPRDKKIGLSPMAPLRFSIQLLNNTNLYAVNFVKNRCTPPGMLVSEGRMDQKQRKDLEKVLDDRYSGPENAGRPLVLWGGLKWHSMTDSGGRPQVAALSGREYAERDTARTLGVPSLLLGLPGDQKYDNILEAKRDFVLSTCLPIMTLLSSTLNNWLLDAPGLDDLYLIPDINSLPEMLEWRTNSFEKINTVAFLSLNEKRELAGFDKIDEKEDRGVYDDLFVDATKVLASDFDSLLAVIEDDEEDGETEEDEGEGEDQDVDGDEDEEEKKAIEFRRVKTIHLKNKQSRNAYRRQVNAIRAQLENRFTKNMGRFFVAQGRALLKKKKEMTSLESSRQILEARIAKDTKTLEKILTRHYKLVFKAMDTFVKAGAKHVKAPYSEAKQDSAFESALLDFINGNLGEHITIINDTTKKRVVNQLRSIFEAAEFEQPDLASLSETIAAQFKDFTLKRAAVIARTETTTSLGEAGRSSIASLGFSRPTKEWVSDQRDSAREGHLKMDGTVLPLTESYKVPNEEGGFTSMKGPGDPDAPVKHLANCICAEIYDAEDIEDEV